MKKQSLIVFALFLLFSVSFVSCNDDDDVKNGGEFTFDNVTYKLDKGEVIYYGQVDQNVYNHNLVFYSKGITVNPNNGEPMSGTGEFIAFDLYSSTPGGIDPITYSSAGTYGVGDIEFGAFAINFNAQNQSFDFIRMLGDANIDVEEDGDRYIVDFDGVTGQGENIVGHFEGPLEYFVDDKKKK